MKPTVDTHIEFTPGICGGKPRIAGHRIRVQDIVVLHESRGLTPDEIVGMYPQLSLADVHASLAYYFDHVDEIRRDIAESGQLANEVRAMIPSKLAAKLMRLPPDDDSISS